MTIDGSLKRKGRLSRSRNVLKRDERIAKMLERGTFEEERDSPFGLPKTRVMKSVIGKKKKKEKKEDEADDKKKKK